VSALEALPAVARELLKRGDRNGNQVPAEEREAVAAMLAETGIRGGQALEWMVKLIRFRLGVGERPSALAAVSPVEQYAAQLAGDRAESIARGVLDARKAAA
jgi:hypothetical protein